MKSVLENNTMKIFKIKNKELYKIITIFGIKLKFPKYSKEYRKLYKELNKIKSNFNYFIDIRQAPKARGQLKKIQLLELYLMNILKQYCDEINVNFWLRGGTCLGAYRHKGFIPWDDDVDLGMIRTDFEKLKNHVNKNSTEFEIKYFYHKDCKVAKFTFRNIKSPIFLDLFPFDWCDYSNAEKLWNNWLEDKSQLMNTLLNMKLKEGYPEDLPQEMISKVDTINEIFSQKYTNSSSKSGIISAIEQMVPRNIKRIFPYEMIFPLKEVQFENTSYYVPNKIEDYLSQYFGEYMSFPSNVVINQHNYMFNENDYSKIDELYNKIIEVTKC